MVKISGIFVCIFILLALFGLSFIEAKPTIPNFIKETLKFMNRSTDPCENFYDFACGNWRNDNFYSSRLKNNVLSQAAFKVSGDIQQFLEKNGPIDGFEYPKQLEKVQQYYKSCIQESKKPITKSSVFLKLIEESGGFPALNPNWDAKKFNVIKASGIQNSYGISNFFKVLIHLIYPYPILFEEMNIGIIMKLDKDNFKNFTDFSPKTNAEEMMYLLRLYGVNEEKARTVTKDILVMFKALVDLSPVKRDKTELDKSDFKLNKNEDMMIYLKHFANITEGNNVKKLISLMGNVC